MRNAYFSVVERLKALSDIPPLVFRLVLAYGFYEPAIRKIQNFDSIVGWFGSLGIPFPTLNAYMATITEASGVILMTLGLFTRLMSIPMMVVMVVAIFTVHAQHGFSCGDNGFEVPFYYLCFLLSLLIQGPGRISLDYVLTRKARASNLS